MGTYIVAINALHNLYLFLQMLYSGLTALYIVTTELIKMPYSSTITYKVYIL